MRPPATTVAGRPGDSRAPASWPALVGGALLAMDRGLGPRPPRALPAAEPRSGAWLCPHGGGRGWRAWIVAANPSDGEVQARVRTFGRRPAGEPLTEPVPAGALRYIEVPAAQAAASSFVEHFGGPLAVAMVAAPPGGGVAAEPCASRGGVQWLVPEGSTARGQSTRLLVMNPFAIDAVTDVTLLAGPRQVRHGDLRGVVIPPGRAVSFDLDAYALGEESLAASVRVTLGRAAVAALVEGEGDVRAALGVPRPAASWVLPGAGDDGTSGVSVMVPGRLPAPFRVRAQRATEQVQVVEDSSVEGGGVALLEVDAGEGGLVVEAAGRERFTAARRTQLEEGGDRAATTGVPGSMLGRGGAGPGPAEGSPRAVWVALPAGPPGGGAGHLVLENPGDEPARASVRLLSEAGEVDAPAVARLTVAPGRSLVVFLPSHVGDVPVAAVVEVESGTLVAAQTSVSQDGYAVSVGVRVETFRRVQE